MYWPCEDFVRRMAEEGRKHKSVWYLSDSVRMVPANCLITVSFLIWETAGTRLGERRALSSSSTSSTVLHRALVLYVFDYSIAKSLVHVIQNLLQCRWSLSVSASPHSLRHPRSLCPHQDRPATPRLSFSHSITLVQVSSIQPRPEAIVLNIERSFWMWYCHDSHR